MTDVPVWARPDAFPESPEGWGWADIKGQLHPCSSLDELRAAIRNDRNGSVALAWAPEHDRMVLPEEINGTFDAVRWARDFWTRSDLEDGFRKLRLYGAILGIFAVYIFYHNYQHIAGVSAQSGTGFKIGEVVKYTAHHSTQLGLGVLLFTIFGFIPWYQAWKRRKELGRWTEEKIAATVPSIRFETWLERQHAPVTKLFLGLIAAVWLVQMFSANDLQAAGLVKQRFLGGETWRLLTAPFLHGNIVHLLMNAAAMAYLGKRLEVFARWPHVPLVFLFSAYIGGEASARFLADNGVAVGASGGLMGSLGFLMVFETLHGRLVPRRARRRLAAGVLLTAFIGLIGYRYIDNAAHLGGMLSGMLYAAVVFPKSASAIRPKATLTDRIAGSVALLILIVAAAFTIWKILGN